MDEAIINKFINNALVYLSCSYASEFENANTNIREIYPYIFHELYLDKNKCKQVMEYDSLGIMYESIIPNSIKKDLGQFYTREDGMIEYMLDKVDLLSGKILEPSCGSGVFVCKIIKKMVSMLQDKGYTACQILDYICENIYANDIDKNALMITEINSLAELLPLMVCARKENENYVMPRLNYTPSKNNPDYWTNGTVPWFRMEDIRENGHVLSDALQYVSQMAVKKNGLFPAYSIALATSATIGEHALITVECLGNQRFTFFSCNEKYIQSVNMNFMNYYFYVIDDWCKEHLNHGSFASVDMTALKKLEIPIPPLPVQEEIVRILDKYTELEAELEAKLSEEIELKQKQYAYYRDKLLTFKRKE